MRFGILVLLAGLIACEGPAGVDGSDGSSGVDGSNGNDGADADAVDADADGVSYLTDCDDSDAAVGGPTLYYIDYDGDGYGYAGVAQEFCQPAVGWVESSDDCDDLSAEVSPEALEICDGLDNNCNGDVDMDDAGVDLAQAVEAYVDVDGDGFGDELGALELVCEGTPGYAEFADDCDDASAATNPDAAEICDDGIDNNCNDSLDQCGLSPSLAQTDADAVLTGTGDIGFQLDASGDFNGDGSDDLLVGGYGSSTGNAYILWGGTSSIADTDLSSSGTVMTGGSGDYFGKAVTALGDVDGDGYDDLAVGAPNDEAVYIQYGSASAATDWTSLSYADMDAAIYNTSAGAFGYTLRRVGDLNADGYDDMVVGAGDDESAYLFYGTGSAWSGDFDVSSSYDALFDDNGSTDESFVTQENQITAGDFDGDGADDLVLSDYWSDIAAYDAGSVYVFMGSTTDFSGDYEATLADTIINGGSSSDKLGDAVGNLGDVNGDGYDDLGVGITGYDPAGGSSAGAAAVYFGSSSGFASGLGIGDAGYTLTGAASSDYLGHTIGGAGDLDGDGVNDLTTGAEGADSGGTYSVGAAYVVYGSTSLAGVSDVSGADVTVTGTSSYGYLGGYSITMGDLDGSGTNELIVGGSGSDEAYIFLGGAL